jgi:hypothetical protein
LRLDRNGTRGIADQLAAFREERHAWIARFKAEVEAEAAALRAELKLGKDRIDAALAAAEAFVAARRKLNEALALLRAHGGLAAQLPKERPPARTK